MAVEPGGCKGDPVEEGGRGHSQMVQSENILGEIFSLLIVHLGEVALPFGTKEPAGATALSYPLPETQWGSGGI